MFEKVEDHTRIEAVSLGVLEELDDFELGEGFEGVDLVGVGEDVEADVEGEGVEGRRGLICLCG